MKHILGVWLMGLLTGGLLLFAQQDRHLEKRFQWQDTSLPSSNTFDNTYNEIWGVAQNGQEYAIIGSTMGTHIFDVTDTTDVDTVDFIPGAAQGTDIIHRDYHDYKGYLYMVSDEGASTLQIADLSPLPDSVRLIYDEDTLIRRAHNIFIDTSVGKLYAMGMTDGNNNSQALQVSSLADPTEPSLLANFNEVSSVHDLYVRNDTVFCNAGFSSAFYVYDFSTPNNPQPIDTLTNYPDAGYNHSGWWSPDGQTYVFTDENHGYDVKICDASDLSNITVIDTIDSGVSSRSIAHNPLIRDSLLYIAYYHDGLYVFDISDPSQAQLVDYYDTYPPADHNSYRGNWGVYPFLPSGTILASDMQSGLYVFGWEEGSDVSTPPIDPKRQNLQLSVSPNPFSGPVQLSLQQTLEEHGQMRLYSAHGELLWKTPLPPQQMHYQVTVPSHLSPGLYYLTVQTSQGKEVQKLIKTR